VPRPDDFPRPGLTVDAVVLTRERPRRVLLIRRGHAPFAGRYALPGGFVERDEDLAPACARELREETGLAEVALEQFRAYGTPGRDPRGWTVSVVHVGEVDAGAAARAKGADDADDARFFPVDALPRPLAFDHDRILDEALAWWESRGREV
jgi:8-oxo-dGTP diphosphatase